MDWNLSFHGVSLLCVTPLVFYLFTREKIPIATTALGLLASMVLLFTLAPYRGQSGTFDRYQVISNFGSDGLITICSLMVLGKALIRTGALEPVSRLVSTVWNWSPQIGTLFVLLLCYCASGLVNDTPLVVLMIPILLGVAAYSGYRIQAYSPHELRGINGRDGYYDWYIDKHPRAFNCEWAGAPKL